MNPRHRRLLIPGLLVLLLVIVVVSSLAQRADATEHTSQVVCRMSDPRITESSGLALSRAYDGIAYTINDSGNAPLIFAIDLTSGETVGTTRIEGGKLRDTEALAIDDKGVLWVADTGDNFERRDDAALYAVPEQGRGDHTVRAKRYPVTYDSDSHNVEALLVHPVTGAKVLVSKGLLTGTIYRLPMKLSTEHKNVAVAQEGGAPAMVTDATYTVDGKYAVLRNYTSMYLLDGANGAILNYAPTPKQKQGETITAEPDALIVGSEGRGSKLVRVPIPDTKPTSVPTPAAAAAPEPEPTGPMPFMLGAVGAAVVLGAGVTLWVRRSR